MWFRRKRRKATLTNVEIVLDGDALLRAVEDEKRRRQDPPTQEPDQ